MIKILTWDEWVERWWSPGLRAPRWRQWHQRWICQTERWQSHISPTEEDTELKDEYFTKKELNWIVPVMHFLHLIIFTTTVFYSAGPKLQDKKRKRKEKKKRFPTLSPVRNKTQEEQVLQIIKYVVMWKYLFPRPIIKSECLFSWTVIHGFQGVELTMTILFNTVVRYLVL